MRNTFHIQLTAQQAAIIASALAQVHGTEGQPNFTGKDADEALFLRDAFGNLPAEDAKLPEGTLHGFAL